LKGDIPNPVTESILCLISSIAPLEARYTNGVSPIDEIREYIPDINSKGLEIFHNLKYGLVEIITNMLQSHSSRANFQYCQHLLWETSNILFQHMLLNVQQSQFVNLSLILLLDHMSYHNYQVACAAIDGISLLAHDKSQYQIEQISEYCDLIVDRICWSISAHLSSAEKITHKEIAISGALYSNC
jgi:hypothetical protein